MALRKFKKVKGKIKRTRKISVPRTKETVGTSKIELVFQAFLFSIGIPVESQFNIGFKWYDFKVKGKNILIEFDGDFWHGNPATLKKPLTLAQRKAVLNDKKKNALAAANGFKLIRVWESDFKNNKAAVRDRLLLEV